MRCGAAVSLIGQTGQSDDIHSPDEWARMVVRRISPTSLSIAVLCTVAISCWPSTLRTMSSPLDNGAYRKVRSPSRGNGDRIVAVSDFSGLVISDCALASAAAMAPIDSLERCITPPPPERMEVNRPELERLARTTWPIASLASSGISPLSSTLALSCSRKAERLERNIPANSAQELDAL